MDIEKIKKELLNLKKLLVRLAESGLSCQGHRVNNGADYHRCSVCGAVTEVMGHADICGISIDEVQHRPDCEFNNLYLKLKAELETEDQT